MRVDKDFVDRGWWPGQNQHRWRRRGDRFVPIEER
jgi:hypothetical protein